MVFHSTTSTCCVADEHAAGHYRIAVFTVVQSTAFLKGRVSDEITVGYYGVAVEVIAHSPAIIIGSVFAESTVGYRWAAFVIEYSATHSQCEIFAEHAVAYGRAAEGVVHSSAAAVWRRTIGIATYDSEAVEHGSFVSGATSENMITVLTVVGKIWAVITIQITAQDCFVYIDIPDIWVWCAQASVTTFNSNTVEQLECCCAIAIDSCWFVDPLRDPNFVAA